MQSSLERIAADDWVFSNETHSCHCILFERHWCPSLDGDSMMHYTCTICAKLTGHMNRNTQTISTPCPLHHIGTEESNNARTGLFPQKSWPPVHHWQIPSAHIAHHLLTMSSLMGVDGYKTDNSTNKPPTPWKSINPEHAYLGSLPNL
jgi:hypothetical protein